MKKRIFFLLSIMLLTLLLTASSRHETAYGLVFPSAYAPTGDIEQVRLRSPGVDAVVYGGRPTFKWYQEPTASSYKIELFDSTNTLIGEWQRNPACTPYCTHRLPTDLEGHYGDYGWRVRTVVSGVEGPWSETERFTYQQLGRTSQVSPENGFITADTTPIFEWAEITGATMYLFQIRLPDDRLVGNYLVSDAVFCVDGGTCTWEFTEDLLPGEYKWHVRAKNGRNFGRWTAYQEFTIGGGTPETFYYDFNGSTNGDWVNVNGFSWNIYNNAYYRGTPSSVCVYLCATTYHNYSLSDSIFAASIRSVGANGGDGFSVLLNARYDGVVLLQAYIFDFYQDGLDIVFEVWRYQSGYWYALGSARLPSTNIAYYHNYEFIIDSTADDELSFVFDEVRQGGIPVIRFHEGSYGVDVISKHKHAHSVDINEATITVLNYSAGLPQQTQTEVSLADPSPIYPGTASDGKRLNLQSETNLQHLWQVEK